MLGHCPQIVQGRSFRPEVPSSSQSADVFASHDKETGIIGSTPSHSPIGSFRNGRCGSWSSLDCFPTAYWDRNRSSTLGLIGLSSPSIRGREKAYLIHFCLFLTSAFRELFRVNHILSILLVVGSLAVLRHSNHLNRRVKRLSWCIPCESCFARSFPVIVAVSDFSKNTLFWR